MKTEDNFAKKCSLCDTAAQEEYLKVSYKFNEADEIISIIHKYLAFIVSKM